MKREGGKEAGRIARLGSAIALMSAVLLSCLALISPEASAGPTYIHGFIENTHWTIEGSPYVIIEDAFLTSDKTLVIDPGVSVTFNEGASLFIGGRLLADASEGENILFTSNATVKHAGDWGSIVLAGHDNVFKNANIEFAHKGVSLEEGASALLQDIHLTNNFFGGIYSEFSTVEIRNATFEENGDYNVYLNNSFAFLESCSIVGSGISVFTIRSSPIVANTTIDSSFLDLVVMEDSHPRWINSTIHEGRIAFEDEISSLLVQWLVTVGVKDVHSTPVSGADVLFSSSLGLNNSFWTGESGRVENAVVTQAKLMLFETIDYNPYLIRASKMEQAVEIEKIVEGNTLLEMSFTVDLFPPIANAGGNRDVDEDVPVQLDASGSSDNEPDFLSVGEFVWEFMDQDSFVRLEGLRVTYVFETPGSYRITLTAKDSGGNADTDMITIWIRDRTPPVSDAGGFREADVGESILLDAGNSSDNDPRFWKTAIFLWIIEPGEEEIHLSGERTYYTFEKAGNYSITLHVEDSGGNTDSDTINVLVRAPTQEFPLIIPATLGILAAALIGGILNTEVGKFGLFKFLLIPLYVKLKRKDILDHFLRGQIYGYIKVHPGENYSTIKRNLQLNNGTLTYHLDVLEREGLIISKQKGSRKVFYPVGMRIPDNGAGLHVIQEDILARVSESPGMSISDLARLIGISRQLTNYHVKKLVDDGRITIERKGVRARCFPSEERIH
ncbi:MAG: PKD domain-containing protein [Thermoplasmata archaeon]